MAISNLLLRNSVAKPITLVGGMLLLSGLLQSPVRAEETAAVSMRGVSGGLTIPSATTLQAGTFAISVGDGQEPQLGQFSSQRNYSLGLGLAPGVELFGRVADYQNPPAALANGPRDMSANIKLQLPRIWNALPQVAVGLTDIGGGAAYFTSRYVVASDQYGLMRWSAGYSSGSPVLGNTAKGQTFDGVFGGMELLLGGTGASVLAEHDGQQRHLGVRYRSRAIPSLGHAYVVGSVQKSFGVVDRGAGSNAGRARVALNVVVPWGEQVQRPAAIKAGAELAAVDAKPVFGAMVATAQDKLHGLQRSLVNVGLERVRVGSVGTSLVIEYENHRYGQNEADAIGIVLGLGAEYAPSGLQRVLAVTHKAGLRLYETSVGVAEFRDFLRDGDALYLNGGMVVARSPSYLDDEVTWISAAPTYRSLGRVEVTPELRYTVATELSVFDYALAANIQGMVPLWTGAELYTSYIQRLSNSENFEPGSIFASSRYRAGLKVAAVQQSFWLGPQIFANVGVGKYNYEAWGVQAEATLFVPGRADHIRAKAGIYTRQGGQSRREASPLSGAYRWIPSPSTWVEAGWQQYSDGSRGPSLMLTRWFGDVGAHLIYRKGGSRQFGGLEITIPLTPRRGMAPGPVTLAGTSQFTRGVRTRLVHGASAANLVDHNAVRDFQLDYNAELRQLNGGRMDEKYYINQIYRMREAFYRYARDQILN